MLRGKPVGRKTNIDSCKLRGSESSFRLVESRVVKQHKDFPASGERQDDHCCHMPLSNCGGNSELLHRTHWLAHWQCRIFLNIPLHHNCEPMNCSGYELIVMTRSINFAFVRHLIIMIAHLKVFTVKISSLLLMWPLACSHFNYKTTTGSRETSRSTKGPFFFIMH